MFVCPKGGRGEGGVGGEGEVVCPQATIVPSSLQSWTRPSMMNEGRAVRLPLSHTSSLFALLCKEEEREGAGLEDG